MKLTLESVPEYNQIHSYDDSHVVIRLKNQTHLKYIESNFVLTPSQLVTNWAVAGLAQLSDSNIAELKRLDPEVILFAVGSGQTVPMQQVVGRQFPEGIGVELMPLGAACRTYNLLLSEHRRVMLAVCF